MSDILDLELNFDLIPDFEVIPKNNSSKRIKTFYADPKKGIEDARMKFFRHNRPIRTCDVNKFNKIYQCNCCSKEIYTNAGIVDHIIPLSCGGTDDVSNLQLLCKICDKKKGKEDCNVAYAFDLSAVWLQTFEYARWKEQVRNVRLRKIKKNFVIDILPIFLTQYDNQISGQSTQEIWQKARK